jgi:hypothetical protein
MATTKKVVKTAPKAATTNTIENIKATATQVNKEVVATANEVAKDLMENGKTVKTVAEKAAKDLTKKMDLEASAKKIKSTANSVNSQVKNVVTEVADVVLKNGKQMTETAVKAAKETITQINLEKGIQTVATTAKNVNEYSLKTADQLIDGALDNGKKWSKVADKAIDGGLKLAEKNQDMVFTTLETVKTQIMSSAVRFSRLFSKN